MKLILPSFKNISSFVKSTFIFSILATIAVWFFIQQDPNIEKIEQYLLKSNEITQNVGNVSNISLVKIVHSQYAIDYENTYTPGYNIYDYIVTGNLGSFLVIVRADEDANHNRTLYSINKIVRN